MDKRVSCLYGCARSGKQFVITKDSYVKLLGKTLGVNVIFPKKLKLRSADRFEVEGSYTQYKSYLEYYVDKLISELESKISEETSKLLLNDGCLQ